MKHLQALIVLVIVVNVVILVLLLLRQPEGAAPLESVLTPLASDAAMEGSRYDLSDRTDELNIVLISMDALRYDHTGLAGGGQGLTPNLDRFADEAVVFHDAVSAAPWTLPSHMSVWTGRWPTVHGITNKLKLLSRDQMVETSLSAGIETYPDALIRQGWVAGGFTGGAGVQGRYGFSRSFDTYLDDRYFGGTDYTVPAALEWLRSHERERFFLFLHGYDTHGQYPLPDGALADVDYSGALDGSIEEQARLREQGLESIENPGDPSDLGGELSADDARFLAEAYASKVRLADQRVGAFLDELRARGLLDRTIVGIISDHGDEFMEHGALDHGHSLYQEQVHVVMMLRLPGYARRHDIPQMVRTIDLFPTVFDTLGLPGLDGVDGRSMLPLLRGQPWAEPAFAETDYRLFVHQRMLRVGKHKLILDLLDGGRELYDLSADPGERSDISSSEPRRTYEMEQQLRGWMEEMGTNPQDYLGVRQDPITIF